MNEIEQKIVDEIAEKNYKIILNQENGILYKIANTLLPIVIAIYASMIISRII